jgi:hypothetical protein
VAPIQHVFICSQTQYTGTPDLLRHYISGRLIRIGASAKASDYLFVGGLMWLNWVGFQGKGGKNRTIEDAF